MSPLSPLSLARRLSATPSRDRDVRTLLKRHLLKFHASTPPLILDELGLCEGDVRVDVATIDAELSGFEIKSPADSLARWPKQRRVYSKVLDRAWLVATEKALDAAKAPSWWGLIRVVETANQLGIRVLRDAKPNPSPDALAIAQLLWHAEALGVLERRGLAHGVRSKRRAFAWQRIVETLTLDDMRSEVRLALRARPIDRRFW
ncbi:MAG: sce7726 family protein [Vicinamibacterales bacterium]